MNSSQSVKEYCTVKPMLSHSYLELRPSPNKGLGVFARQDIGAYTKLVSDPALLTLGPSEDLMEAFQQYASLPTEIKNLFLQFHSFDNPARDQVLAGKLAQRGIAVAKIPEMVKVSSIFTSNAFNVDETDQPGLLRRSMFPTVSRINHSCVPNAHTNYDPRSGRMTVYSLSKIARDDEVEISYFNLLLPWKQRQERSSKWGFKCECPACAVEGSPEQIIHESRRTRIREIEMYIYNVTNNANATLADVRHCVEQGNEMVGIAMEHESLKPQLSIAYDYLGTAQILNYELEQDVSRLESIEDNLRLAMVVETNITGADSPATQKRREKLQVFEDVRRKIMDSSTPSGGLR